jgi:hypothetical protein
VGKAGKAGAGKTGGDAGPASAAEARQSVRYSPPRFLTTAVLSTSFPGPAGGLMLREARPPPAPTALIYPTFSLSGDENRPS